MKIGHHACVLGAVFASVAAFGCSSSSTPGSTDSGVTGTGGTTGSTGGAATSTGGATTSTGGAAASTGGAATSTGGASSGTAPTLQITAPANNAVVQADDNNPDVPVTIVVANFTLKDPGRTDGSSCPKNTCGHIHLLVDDGDGNFAACDGPIDETDPSKGKFPYNSAGVSLTGNSIGLDYCPSITGHHTLKGEIHNDDHSAVLGSDGKVITSNIVSFKVPSGEGGKTDGGGTPTDAGKDGN